MLGALLGAGMQAFLIEDVGWRGAFWIATLLPLMMLPIVYFGLPESLRFLATKDPTGAKTMALVRKLQSAGAEPVVLKPADPVEKPKGWRVGPFSAGMGATTLLLWLAFICSFIYISAGVWKTTVFRDVVELPWKDVAATTAINTAAGAVGMVAVGACIDRFGFRAVIPVFFVIAAAAAFMVGATAPGTAMFVGLALLGCFQHAAHAGVASLASAIYPTSMRATGVGWAYGAGRAASILGPLLGATVLEYQHSAIGYFSFLAIPLALAGVAVFVVTSRTQVKAQKGAVAH
jgi:AAHS family 4-hydroxybenzoate transporter-like MFS transporter